MNMQDRKKIFNQVLKELSEKELKEFIGKHCKTNVMQNKFLTHFSHKIEGKAEEKFQMIIDSAIKACSSLRGHFFIDPRKTNSALKPLFKLLEKEKVSYNQKPYESYVFAKLVLENFGELYEHFYEVQDTDIVDNLFYDALEILDAICQSKTTPFEFKEEIFGDLLTLSQELYFNKSSSYYDGGVDLDLLNIVSKCATTEDIFEVIEVIESKIKRKDKYDRKNFIALKIELLKKHHLDDALSATIEENMDEEDVRDMVIEKALKKNEIEKAIAYIKEAIELFSEKNYAGIVSKYEKKLLQVYKNNKMDDAYLSFLWQVYRKDFSGESYDLLKKKYSNKEWKEQFLKIIDEIKTDNFKNNFYYGVSIKLADIYVKEKMQDELFVLIKKNAYFNFLESYGKYCKENYSSEILNMYELHIVNQLEHKDTRKQYAKLAKLIKTLSQTYDGGEVFGKKIYRHVKQKYANRPALLEEMSILDYLDADPSKNIDKKKDKSKEKEQKSLF
jgi:hypothetical protein